MSRVSLALINPHQLLNHFGENKMAAGTYRNVCWTLNNPEDMVMFDADEMEYLIYQEEIGEGGTYHFQGYCEFTKQTRHNKAKALLGGNDVHIAPRAGTQKQAIDYCKKDDTRVGGPYEDGTPRTQGKRMDLEGFKNEVMEGARLRDLLDDHWGVIARYPKFYQTLTMINRPVRTNDLVVTLHFGDTGLGKTRAVMDEFGASPEFYRTPLNNGTMWFDTYDGQRTVLLDDFTGASSHLALCTLLQLLDRYPVLVPTKGSHTWWLPDAVHVTTNLLPKDWYKWENRGHQYLALARRFHQVYLYYVPLSGTDCGRVEQDARWWEENKPDQALY